MAHQGRAIVVALRQHELVEVGDVAGDQRRGMKVEDLLHMFERVRGEQLADDALLLS